jgi:hypothetical protein
VSNLSMTPAKGTLTAHGEVSLAVGADVTMWYYL